MARIITLFLVLILSVLMVACKPDSNESIIDTKDETSNSTMPEISTDTPIAITNTPKQTEFIPDTTIQVSTTEPTETRDDELKDLDNTSDKEIGFGEFVDVDRP